MREIKFRAWDNANKRFDNIVAGNLLYQMCDTENEDIDPEYGTRFFLQQFTGLKDKNGKEIYEGDIVEVEYQYRNTKNPDKLVCKFTNGAFNFFYKGIERIVNVDTTVYSVIGNIYEHQHLLTHPAKK